jgi:large exoprotein involved in heme utilization and adhesion
VNLQNKSVISTSSEGLGNAGSISLAVKRFEAGGGSSVSSSSIATGQSGNAGAIAINAEDMSAESIRIANASSISTSAAGTGKGGNIQLDVTDLSLSDESSVRSTGNDGDAGTVVVKAQNSPSDTVSLQNKSVISTSSEGLGNAGSISLAVKRFEAGGGSSVSSSSTAKGQSGNAGAITINADDRSTGSTESTSSIRLTNASSISTSAAGTGKGGNIQLGVADLSLENESSIRSTGNDGDAGTIVISGNSPSETIRLHNQSVISTSSEGLGNAGSITLAANRLDLDVESSISSSSLSTGEGGNAGRIEIAGNDLNLRGKSFIATETRGRGNAGAIAMMLNRLEMETGAFISSESKSTGRGGHAGVITIQADERIRLTGGNVFIGTTTSGEGAGGDIYLDTRLLEMNGGAFISSASLSENTAGNAGSIRIQCADSILLQEGSSITTEALNAGGGIIWIYVANQLYLKDSAISTSVRFGAGNGGDIEIFDPEFLILKNARIIANAYEGRGGNIHIVTGLLIQSAGSVVSASSELGIDGTVNIESPDANLSGALVSLPANFLDAAVWALKPCSERVGETASSLVVVERDGVSMSPEDWTPGPY